MSTTFEISYPSGEFSLPMCVSSGQVFRWRQLEDGAWIGVDGANWYRVFAEREGIDGVATLSVTSNGTCEDFKSLFRLDWDSGAVKAEILKAGPEMGPYIGAMPGLRVMRPSSPVETFFCFLCTPNNNVKRIIGMVGHLASHGEVLEWVEGHEFRTFPTVARVASLSEDSLRGAGFGYRGGTIPRIAQDLLNRGGEEYLLALRSKPYEDAHRELCTFAGIGPKLADCIALFALDCMEAAPVDTHLWQAVVRLYFPHWNGKALTDQKYREIGSFLRGRFGKLTGWAHQYLFYDNLLNWRNREG